MSARLVFASFSLAVVAWLATSSGATPSAFAAEPSATPAAVTGVVELQPPALATATAQASESGKLASASSQVQQIIQEKKDQDLTETGGKQKSRLAAFLDEHPISSLSWHNPVQVAIRQAIENGLPANIIVVLLLFPLIASMIAASRHVIGLTGFGIYIPAVLSVAFVSTGVLMGVATFLAVLAAAMISHKIVKRLKLPYLPRTAMLLWGVSVFILGILIASSILGLQALISINIFPLLITMLLSENFMETQLLNSQKEAIRLTLETLFIAIFCSFLISLEAVQQFVLLRPELTLLGTVLVNSAIGRYSGLRLLEYLRFQSILEKK